MTKKDERDRILGHEDEADGIQEYDNPMPDWWLGLFWASIIFAVAYTVHYHFIADRSPQKALARELAAAEVRWPTGETAADGGAVVLTDEAAAAGAEVFSANCVSCHGAELQGGIGPSLVDDEWVHGGSAEEILNTVTNGVIEKGMLAWGPILGAERIARVTAYVVQQNARALGRPFPPDNDDGAGAEASEDGSEEHGHDGEDGDG